jgi:Mn2+/Fe2+ NRAMP family transporter
MILLINKPEIMGEWANSRWLNSVSWISVVVVIGLTLAYVAMSVKGVH